MTEYPHLFSPLEIGNTTVRNRLMQTAHGKAYSVRNLVSRRDYDYKVARAAGGIGLMITGSRPVHPTGAQRGATLGYLREGIGFDRRLTAAVRDHGAAIFGQLAHVGMMMPSDGNDDPRFLWSSSATPSANPSEVAKEMEPEDMDELVDSYRASAEIIRAGGYQGVELHFAHSYLIHQFLSSMFNRRTDEYGGPIDNRLRLPMRIVEAVRGAVGADYVVGVRLGMTDFLEGAHDVADTIAIVTALRDSGNVDYVSLSAAGFNKGLEIAPSDVPSGHMVGMASEVKAAVSGLITFIIGGLNDPAQADELIRNGRADMVAMTRTMIADPDFPNKVREGREDEVYHCIRANQGCISRVFRGLAVACTVNPATGREALFATPTPRMTATARRWLVVGGGPAGMKAAEGLGRAGHDVVLLEAEDRLGGQVNLAMQAPGRDTFAWIVTDLRTHLEKLGVEIRLGVRATAGLVAEENPHGVVIATGALPGRDGFSNAAPLTPRLPGAELAHVLTPWEVLGEDIPTGARVVVLDGDGSRYAAGTTEVLLDRGSAVELISPHTDLFPTTATTLDRTFLYQRLFSKGLAYRLNSWVSEITLDSVVAYNLYSGQVEVMEDVDNVVIITGRIADDRLYKELEGRIERLHRIGDCVAPRSLDHAIYEGFAAGRELWSLQERQIGAGQLEAWKE